MSHPFKLLCNQQAGSIREVFSTKNIWLKMIYGFLKIQARMIHVVHWCSIFEPCVLVAGSFYQQYLKDRICGIRHCSKALRWQERVKDSHGPDLQDILRYVPSIPFPSNITCPSYTAP
jgi:hypothetical protein